MTHTLSRTFLSELEAITGAGKVLTDPADLICYSYDASGIRSCPGAVVLPEDTTQVSAIVSLCSRYNVPIFPRGAGSGTTGASVPLSHGIVLALTRMNRIMEISTGNLTATVQPGVITGVLQKQVSELGLFYPPDPASLSFCTIGGNVNTGAGGARAVKYGVTKDYVLSLQVVLASGHVIDTGHETAKGVAGYDLTRLMVGSEGTLGIITEITLRLIPAVEATGTALVFFANTYDACNAVKSFFESRILPRCAEYFDYSSIRCIEKLLPAQVPEGCRAMLLIEVDGPLSSIKSQLDTIMECCSSCRALSSITASNSMEAEAMWKARRGLSPAIRRLGYSGKVSEDICVPRQMLPEAVARLEEIARKHHTRILTFGHAGDGNLHVNLLFDRSDRNAVNNMERAVSEIMRMAVGLSGTISGEHGIGLTKKEFMNLDTGETALSLMRGIKQLFDPHGLFNPGKVWPDR